VTETLASYPTDNPGLIVFNAATFTFAGHDTTANTMTWLIFEMSQHEGSPDGHLDGHLDCHLDSHLDGHLDSHFCNSNSHYIHHQITWSAFLPPLNPPQSTTTEDTTVHHH
jgi:hypothetical protein